MLSSDEHRIYIQMLSSDEHRKNLVPAVIEIELPSFHMVALLQI